MQKLNLPKTRDLIQSFKLSSLFINELGWNNPSSSSINLNDSQAKPIAELGGITVFEISAENFPNSQQRAEIHQKISTIHHENLLIFLDNPKKPSKSIWYWHSGKQPREHYYFQGQPGDLFISKLSALFVDLSELEDSGGDFSVLQVSEKLKKALDVETVTKKFYQDFQAQHLVFLELIQGINSERDLRWYASILLNRLMFIWFLQKKGFLDKGNMNYLPDKLSQQKDGFYSEFLSKLFFEGFAKPQEQRSAETNDLLGDIRYLNGGLFLKHPLEIRYDIQIEDKAFSNLFELFGRYSWSLNDTPGGDDNEINPDVLGYIFEKYINQKQFGAYYTRTEITDYLCEQTIHQLILQKINHAEIPGSLAARQFDTVPELLFNLDANLCYELYHKVLPKLSLLDPACGSGAFLIAMMKTLINVYSAIIGKIPYLRDTALKRELKELQAKHANILYFIKKRIITDNLFGVDIMEEATEIARLRLFLALVSSAESVEDLEPLPNIDFNILAGNSLLGLMQVEAQQFDNKQDDLFRKSYQQVLAEKNAKISSYRDATTYAKDLGKLRDEIEAHKKEAKTVLDEILLDEFNRLKIKFEQATWDDKKNKLGKAIKRGLKLDDFEDLHLFHWGYEFDEILNLKGGFDAIITNPPWEIFKPQAKEFFNDYSEVITKNKMTIKVFEKEKAKLLQNAEILETWLAYQSRFPHLSKYFRLSSQYPHQIAMVNGRKTGSDINLYKLFLEQCFNLLRNDGQCGIVIPSGIYTDLGATGLRNLLFNETKITGLFCFENRKKIFEGVDSRFKFVVLSFAKGGNTSEFPAAFMRHDVNELVKFPKSSSLRVKTDMIYRLSPDSHSVMEFKSEMDVRIAEKMLQFPLLGEKIEGVWNLALTREFDMTNDSYLFYTENAKGRLPLYEGKMIHQFVHNWGKPKYWLDEQEARKVLLGKKGQENGQSLDYQKYRLGFRDVAASTNERTMIATILPPKIFCPHTMSLENVNQSSLTQKERLFLVALFNSYLVDYLIRQRITAHLSFFFIYNIPIPRLTKKDSIFNQIVTRAAKLICTTPEFDDLAKEVGLESGVINSEERAEIRAELDAMVAHLYGLTYEEFRHILGTFPIVKEEVKVRALEKYEYNGLTEKTD